MDNQAYVDPDRLRAFAGDLSGFVSVVDRCAERLLAKLPVLGNTWEDAEYTEFKNSVLVVSRTLSEFIVEANGFSAYLNGKANEADSIHRGSLPPTARSSSAEWKHAVKNSFSYEPQKGEVFFCGKCNRQQQPTEGELCKTCGSMTVSWHTDREHADGVMNKWRLVNGLVP